MTHGLYKINDPIGAVLSYIRIKAVLPFVRGRLIDLACGDNALVQRYGSGVGVDIIDHGKVDMVLSDFSHLPFRDKAADTITIVASINYFDNPLETLRETHRVLTDKGNLILTMPNYWMIKIWHKIREPEAKSCGFKKQDLKKMFIDAGYKIDKIVPFMVINNIFIASKL